MFCVIGPGAGFTTTHGYIANLPKELPDYQEKCLRIYDAVDYAENAFNIPMVAYSGENDAQKKAADNIENAAQGVQGAGEVHAPRRAGPGTPDAEGVARRRPKPSTASTRTRAATRIRSECGS